MNISQVFKLCIVAGVIFTIFTGITFMMSSSDSEQMKNNVKDVVRQFKVDKVISNQKIDAEAKNDVFDSPKDSELQPLSQPKNSRPILDSITSRTHTKTADVTVRPEVLRQLQEVKTSRTVSIQAFYYPWYDSPNYNNDSYRQWNHEYLPNWDKHDEHVYPTGHHIPPDDIGSWYYPKLGPYSSRDPDVIDQHMKWMSSAGIDVAVTSWLPLSETAEGAYSWDSIVPLLLNASEKYRMKLAFHLEPYKTRTSESVRSDIIYLIENYGNHSAFYRTFSKASKSQKELPLFYIYDSYRISKDEWHKVTNKNGSHTLRGTPYDSLLIGLHVNHEHRFDLQQAGFDGLYTYFASEGFSHGSTMSNWPALSTFCSKNDMLFIPSVGPGYIDTRVRAWNGKNTKDRDNGNYYREHFKMAHTAKADIVSITSFNEWHEGTQIEPAVPHTENNSTYLEYDRDSDEYLEITLQMVKQYFTPHHENIPMQIANVV
jgi:glycoprotein endo-alpha-1,2-mannosidase